MMSGRCRGRAFLLQLLSAAGSVRPQLDLPTDLLLMTESMNQPRLSRGAVLFLLALWSCAIAGRLPGQQSNPNKAFDRDQLVAWCIVPFDGKQRGPAARAEMLWLKDVLGQTEGIAVTADEIADKEIDAIVNGTRDQNRWLDSSGKPVVDIVRSKAVEEGWDEERLEHAIVDQLESKILPTVNSTLGRLKELGLVYPVKRGRRTLYKATPAGKDWIGEWDKEPDDS